MKTNTLARSRDTIHEIHDCRAIDGDTIIGKINLGFGTWLERRFRLRGFFAPELDGQCPSAAIAARNQLQAALDGHVVSFPARGSRDDRFGRLLIHLMLDADLADPRNVLLGHLLTEDQHRQDLEFAARNRKRGGVTL